MPARLLQALSSAIDTISLRRSVKAWLDPGWQRLIDLSR
jgi:hypothetical protein